MNIKNILQQFGISDEEADVYMLLMKIHKAPSSLIAKKLNIKRTSAYNILNRMTKKGLIYHSISNKIKYFSSTDPEKLIGRYQASLNKLNDLIPLISTLGGLTDQHQFEFFEGEKSILGIYDEIVKSDSEILCLFHPDAMYDFGKNKMQSKAFDKIRIKNKIPFRVLSWEDSLPSNTSKDDEKCLRQTRFFKSAIEPFYIEVYQYGNKIAFLPVLEYQAFVTNGAQSAMGFRSIFNALWGSDMVYKAQK